MKKRCRIQKVLNNVLKLIENTQSVTLKLHQEAMNTSVNIMQHIFYKNGKFQKKLLKFQHILLVSKEHVM